jgi:hypothetical protein
MARIKNHIRENNEMGKEKENGKGKGKGNFFRSSVFPSSW